MFDDEQDINAENLPIFRKGKEIFDAVRELCELIPEENEFLQHLKSELLSDAALLHVKVAGAEHAELYDLKMEAATIIRKAAQDSPELQKAIDVWGVFGVDDYSKLYDIES
jgi:hypothetical protein